MHCARASPCRAMSRVRGDAMPRCAQAGRFSAIASIKAFMREGQALQCAGYCKAASKGDDWTDALEADFVRQYKELEARDGKIE